jgi:hypothetical protein
VKGAYLCGKGGVARRQYRPSPTIGASLAGMRPARSRLSPLTAAREALPPDNQVEWCFYGVNLMTRSYTTSGNAAPMLVGGSR